MDNLPLPHNQGANVPAASAIAHTPAVAVGKFGDGVGPIWIGFLLILSGLFPLLTLLTTLGDPRYMNTLGNWLLVSPLMLVGTIVAAFGIKEKGYQKEGIRLFGLVSFITGLILFIGIPVLASLLYANGIGN